MRWGLALGAAATVGAAALIGTQWAGKPTPAPEPSDVVEAAGMAFTGAWGSIMIAGVAASIPGLDPAGEGVIESSDELPADDKHPAGQRTSKTRVSVTGSGSRITLVSEVEIHEVRGTSRLNGRTVITVSLDYCPDQDGKVVAAIDYKASGDNAAASPAETGGYSINVSAKGQATAQVDDQAVLTRIDQTLTVEHSTRGGQGSARREDVRGAYVLTLSSAAGQALRAEVSRSDNVKATGASVGLLQLGLAPAIASVFEKAQAKWRGGACLELVLRPPVQTGGKANATKPKERKNFEVAVRHKIEQVELPLPIDASLDGRDTLEPKRVDKAPGRFEYVSGPEPKDYGNVALKSVSRRGIAEEKVAFDNREEFSGSFSARTSGVMQAVAEGTVFWERKAGAADTFVPSGTLRVSGKRRDCTVRGEADLAESDGELELRRDVDGRAVEYRGSGIKVMPLKFTCPRASGTRNAPVAWFGTTGVFRPIAADGTLEGTMTQGDVAWTWRFAR
jgi:hypothetical protein